ncbi:SPOR domain-containing protein [Aestuariibacter halophilus]|uniref:SPOR domain-containing protein n=1 Tax=Fluctibacter halophilus TaxID=226011 RepID=A0ABS8GBR4_9ALTE|nr:SPOR domain-containing protein [Aestuariibacter halophilus]MCC2617184.1 SPOR domain-containing protein [Aestuariibacter halophilus]
MAHKDYVGRGRAAPKQNNRKEQPKPPLPWLRIVITLALLIGFVVFLWTIRDNAEQAPASGNEQQSQKEQALPELQEEEWEFIKQLPSTTVEVEVEEQELSERPYLMQCGSFRTEEQAEELKARIAFQGLESQVRASNGKNGLWYRVILGPYTLKRAAETDRHTLRRANINNCKIWYWNLD